jgi:hypothetical protein
VSSCRAAGEAREPGSAVGGIQIQRGLLNNNDIGRSSPIAGGCRGTVRDRSASCALLTGRYFCSATDRSSSPLRCSRVFIAAGWQGPVTNRQLRALAAPPVVVATMVVIVALLAVPRAIPAPGIFSYGLLFALSNVTPDPWSVALDRADGLIIGNGSKLRPRS